MQTAAEWGASSLPSSLPRFFSAHRRGAPKAERRRRKGKKVGIKRRRRRRRQRRRSEDKSPSQPRSLSSSPPFLPTDRPEGVLASSLVLPGDERSGSGWDERVEENPRLWGGGGVEGGRAGGGREKNSFSYILGLGRLSRLGVVGSCGAISWNPN